jgi:hypothetical protein
MTQHQPASSFQDREQLVQAYSQLIREKMNEGRLGYFMNLMFNQLPGSRRTKMEIMRQGTERVHSILMHHILHRPEAAKWAHLRPIFVGSLDLPVFKWDRGPLGRLDVVNDGLHVNVIALVPPHSYSFIQHSVQCQAWGPRSRLTVPLDQHFKEESRFYLNERLARLHVTPITEGTMADYTLKAFKHGRVDVDSLLILN